MLLKFVISAIGATAILLAQTAYTTSGTVLVLDVGATQVLVTNTGSLGGVQTIDLPVGVSQRAKVWLSRFSPLRGSESACASPCSISLNQEFGPYFRLYEICDSTGNPLSPRRLSSLEYMPAIIPTPSNSPYVVPFFLTGTKGNQKSFNFSIAGGQDVSALRLWLWTFDMARKQLSVGFNSQPVKLVDKTDILVASSNGSTCSFTTRVPHGLTNGQSIQLNYFLLPGTATLNGTKTATVTGGSSFTVPCSLANQDWSAPEAVAGGNLPPFRPGYPTGKTVSGTVWESSEEKFFGGIDSNGEAFQLMIAIGASELTAGATNIAKFQFNGNVVPGLRHLNQWILDWNVVEPDIELDQIVVTGGDPLHATAHTTATHNYQTGDTVIIQNAPGPLWRFNLERVITSVSDNRHFTFLWGPDTDGFQEYAGLTQTPSATPGDPFYTAPATYTVRTARDNTVTPDQHMYAARAIIAKSSFVAYDPATDRVPAGNATNGHTLFDTQSIKDLNPYFNYQEQATCTGCHMEAGFSLRYGNFPTDLIKMAAIRDGFEDSAAEDVVTFIKSRTRLSGTYTSGITATGATGTTCTLSSFNGGGSGATATVFLTGTNTIAGGSALVVPYGVATGYTSAPTSATASNGTATCSGTAVVSTSIIPPLRSRPWNPLKQGGPTMATTAPADLLAGAGLRWKLVYDQDLPEYLIPGGSFSTWAGSSNLDLATIPMPIANPHWHRWFPLFHPLDFFASLGLDFTTTAAWTDYLAYKSSLKATPTLANYEGANFFLENLRTQIDMGAARIATGMSDYKNNPNNGEACYEAPTMACQMYHHLSIWWSSRMVELIQAIPGLEGQTAPIYQAKFGSVDSHSAAYHTNGILCNCFFDTGPHKSNIGDQAFHHQFTGLWTQSITNLDTDMWYMLQMQDNNAGNHKGMDDNPIDMPYNYAFTHQLSFYRPMFWTSVINNTLAPQASWGWTNLVDMTSHWLFGSFTVGGLGVQYTDQFVTEAEKATWMNEYAQQFLELETRFPLSATWQAKFPCNSEVHPSRGFLGARTQFCDDMSMALPVLNYYSVNNGTPSSADIDSIVSFMQSTYPSPGGVAHTWSTDRSQACSFNWASIGLAGNNPPPILLGCANWNN